MYLRLLGDRNDVNIMLSSANFCKDVLSKKVFI